MVLFSGKKPHDQNTFLNVADSEDREPGPDPGGSERSAECHLGRCRCGDAERRGARKQEKETETLITSFLSLGPWQAASGKFPCESASKQHSQSSISDPIVSEMHDFTTSISGI